MLPSFLVDTLVQDDLSIKIIATADQLAEQFVSAMREEEDFDLTIALAGLQLTFLSQVAKLTRGQQS